MLDYRGKSEYSVWKKIEVPLEMFWDIDFSQLIEIRIGEWNAGEYWFDLVYLSN